MKPIKTIIPATPGFYLVEPITDENNVVVEAALIPVIGWAFHEHSLGTADHLLTVAPVTTVEIVTTDCPPILEEKTGRVFSYLAEHPTIENWINSQNEKEKNRVRLDRMLDRKREELGITTKPKNGGKNVV